MNNILTKIKIDLYSSTSYEVIKAQQGDKNSRIIEFILYNQGEPYEFPDNIFFRFVGHRGDGSSFSKTEEECITRNGNHVRVTLPEDVLYYDGTIEAKLVMYEHGSPAGTSAESRVADKLSEKPERTVLSTIPFKISCIRNPCNENNLSEGELSIVTDLIFQMEEFSKNAQDVIDQAQASADKAKESEDNAKVSETNAKKSENDARVSELNAAGSAATAAQKSDDASGYAKQAQSYALGTGGSRPGEDNDNAKQYYEQAKSYAVGDTGKRENEENNNAKYYCEEAQKTYDLLKLSGNVTGVKGDAEPETAYHTGNVNLTPDDIGTHSKSYINQNFIAGHVSHKRKLIPGSGWFRIAFLKTNGNGSSACTIKLSRTYNYRFPEYQEIKLFKAYNTYKFVAVNAFCAQYWSQIRLVKCEDGKYYVDIYNSNPQGPGTGQNEWDVLVENNGMIYPWEAMEAKLVDSSDTGELITSLNLPVNLDAGNYLQNGGQIPVVGKDKYIAYPNDAYYQVSSASVTGYIGITLPVSWTNTFVKFSVSIFNLVTGESCDYHISGYNYASTPTWSNCTAVCVGKAGSARSNLNVRFGHNGTKCMVCIGETNTTWVYPVIQVHDVVLGYYKNDFETWKSGWDIHFYTGLPGTINQTVSNTHVAYGGVAISAATATKAIQDGNGDNIAGTYERKGWIYIGEAYSRGGDFEYQAGSPDNFHVFLIVISEPAAGFFDTHYIPYDILYNDIVKSGETINYRIDTGNNDCVIVGFVHNTATFTFTNSTYNREVRIYAKT